MHQHLALGGLPELQLEKYLAKDLRISVYTVQINAVRFTDWSCSTFVEHTTGYK
jgi:hypothetical protein